ncbi:MAG: UdgX family uracil-DNA binding protein [Novosphingobium sp.]
MTNVIRTVMPCLGFATAWREAARTLLQGGVRPEDAEWQAEDDDQALSLFDRASVPASPAIGEVRIPRALLGLIEIALCADVPDRFSLPYRAVWRARMDPYFVGDESDPDMARLRILAKLVKRDGHKMKAFVRFREIEPEAGERRNFHAWFEPDHFIVEATAPFFARRFGDMDWRIETPKGCARCDNGDLAFSCATVKPQAVPDATDELWQTYYANIFNPARLKVKAMQAEMPKKYWKNLPEAKLIPALVSGAESRVMAMRDADATSPALRSLRMKPYVRNGGEGSAMTDTRQQLEVEIARCTRCPLYCNATQAVCGEGPSQAGIMILGEQPGDQEDLAGRPFVGPAGRELDAAFAAAKVDRGQVYVTNAVKHFKHTMRGKRRLHERPNSAEITACRWWIEQEIALVKPSVIVALGATASLSLTGNGKGVIARQGKVEQSLFGPPVIITGHPAAILRVPSAEHADQLRHQLADALRSANATR